MKIKALPGKIIPSAQALRDISGLDLTECANIVQGRIEFPDECFTDFCNALGNPDLYFELTE